MGSFFVLYIINIYIYWHINPFKKFKTMKKILLVAAVAGLAMVSCKKEYTCECTTTSKIYLMGIETSSGPQATSGKTEKMKKADAKTKCEKDNGTITTGDTQNGSSVTIACSIKE